MCACVRVLVSSSAKISDICEKVSFLETQITYVSSLTGVCTESMVVRRFGVALVCSWLINCVSQGVVGAKGSGGSEALGECRGELWIVCESVTFVFLVLLHLCATADIPCSCLCC
jgi:hypothetical protein